MARMSAAERREKLLAAAITVMCRDGVAHTTTRSIVAEAGMQIGVFHYCFRSKEELILEVMKTINERSYEAVGEVLDKSTDPEALFSLALRAYWSHIEANPLEHLLTYELTQYALRQPGQRSAAIAQYDSYTTGMEGLLTAFATIGGFTWRSPLDVLARFILAVIEGLTFQWLVSEDPVKAQELLDHLGRYLMAEALIPAAAQ